MIWEESAYKSCLARLSRPEQLHNRELIDCLLQYRGQLAGYHGSFYLASGQISNCILDLDKSSVTTQPLPARILIDEADGENRPSFVSSSFDDAI